MKHLLDTHVLLWWIAADRRLAKAHARVLERNMRSGTPVGLSVLTLWEIAKLAAAERIQLDESVDEYLAQLESNTAIEILPLDRRIAVDCTRLGSKFHADPIDQVIAATARCHGLTLLTSDRNIIESGVVDVI